MCHFINLFCFHIFEYRTKWISIIGKSPCLNNQIIQISKQIRKQDLVEKSALQEENSDNLYEPNSSITALELIERIPDLTDRRKILSTVFIKKMKLKQSESMDETTTDVNAESHETFDESITPVAKSYEVRLDAFSQIFVGKNVPEGYIENNMCRKRPYYSFLEQ